MIGQTFSSCDPVPLALRARVRIEVHEHIASLPWLQVGQQGTITSVRKDVIYVTLDALSAPLPVTTVISPVDYSSVHRPPAVIATATHPAY